MLPLIYMERYFSKSLIYITLYQSIIVLKYQKENCFKFFSLLCKTSSSLCIFQCTLAARDSCSTNLKTTEQSNQQHSLGRPLFFSITQVGESSSSMYSPVEVPEIWISLPDPGRWCFEQDAQLISIDVQHMLEDLLIYIKAYVECLAEGISTIRKVIQDPSVSVLRAHSAPSETQLHRRTELLL